MNADRIRPPPVNAGHWLPLLVLLTTLLAALPSVAQYKVVGPDGKVTYTDRQPATAEGKVSALGARSAPSTESNLPFELRQPVARYPVVLYTSAAGCDPCESARQLLRQRGVPFTEKQLIGAEDGDALERLSGGRDAPTLSVGAQTLRGLAPVVWGSYLDAAGYPRESRLPASYQAPAPTPLVAKRELPPEARASAVRPVPPPAADAPPPAPGSIKF